MIDKLALENYILKKEKEYLLEIKKRAHPSLPVLI
jgi:hypothetical protein